MDRVGTLERLGASPALAWSLLGVLAAHGWDCALTRSFAGVSEGEPGFLVIAAKGPLEVRRVAESPAAAACAVLDEVARLAPIGGDVQLPLPLS